MVCGDRSGKASFSTSIRKQDQKQFTFTGDQQQHTYACLSQGYINFLALCLNIVQRDLYHLDNLKKFMLVCDLDDIMLIESGEQKIKYIGEKHALQKM